MMHIKSQQQETNNKEPKGKQNKKQSQKKNQ